MKGSIVDVQLYSKHASDIDDFLTGLDKPTNSIIGCIYYDINKTEQYRIWTG